MCKSEVVFQYAFSKRIYGISQHSIQWAKKVTALVNNGPKGHWSGFTALISPALQTYPALQTGSWS